MIALRPAEPADAPAIAAVHVASWRATYAATLPRVMVEPVTVERRQVLWQVLLEQHRETHPTLVAVDDAGGVVGFGMVSAVGTQVPGFEGEFHSLFLHPDFQRRDVGRRLFQALAALLLERRCPTAIAWVLESAPAMRFFEAMGGTLLSSETLAVAGGSVTQHLYGWRDLAAAPPLQDR